MIQHICIKTQSWDFYFKKPNTKKNFLFMRRYSNCNTISAF